MASFSATIFHHRPISSFFPHSNQSLSHLTTHAQSIIPPLHAAADPDKDKTVETANDEPPKAVAATPKPPKKPVYSMKKGQIVRVDKEKYLNSINYLSVGHPPNYKGLDYIYEDRGEVLDIRIFETGEYALFFGAVQMPKSTDWTCKSGRIVLGAERLRIAWVGIPTAPAWLPTYMLIKSDKLNYERM